MDALFESIEHRTRPQSSFVAVCAPEWIRKFAPFLIRPVTKHDHASWQGYEYVVITQYGDDIAVMGRKEEAQVIADGLNERFAGMLMTEGTKAEDTYATQSGR